MKKRKKKDVKTQTVRRTNWWLIQSVKEDGESFLKKKRKKKKKKEKKSKEKKKRKKIQCK